MKNNKKGFTLIELLVVIAIIGLLAGVVYAAVMQAMIKANDSKRRSHLDGFRINMERYLNGGGSAYGTDGWIEVLPTAANSNDETANKFVTDEGFYTSLPKDPNYFRRHGSSPRPNLTGYVHSGIASSESYCFYAKLEIPPKSTDIHYCDSGFTHNGRQYCKGTYPCTSTECDMNYKVCSNDN